MTRSLIILGKAFWGPFSVMLRLLALPARWAKPAQLDVVLPARWVKPEEHHATGPARRKAATLDVSLPARWVRPASGGEPVWAPPADDPRQLWRAIEERRATRESPHHLWQVVEQRRANRGPELGSEPAAVRAGKRSRRQPTPAGRKRRVSMVLAIVTFLVVAAGSFAEWKAGGTGNGRAAVGTVTHQVVFTAGTVTGPLYPGGSGDVALTVANANAFSVRIPSIVLDPTQGTNGFTATGCLLAQAHLSFTGSTLNNGGSGWDVPANATSFAIDLPNAVSMGTAAANACQSATFTVYLQVGT